MPQRTSQNTLERFAPWLIVMAVALSFGRCIGDGIAPNDDRDTIFLNPRINRPDHAPDLLGDDGAGYYWTHSDLKLYIPVTYTVWFLIAKITWVQTPDELGTHLDPRIFHAASLLLHVANTLLVYCLLRRLLRTRQTSSPWPALIGALLYGLHPLQVESVAWTSGMKDLLYCGFSLLALLAYVRSVEPSASAIAKRSTAISWAIYSAGIVALILGMLCKPTAMVMPAIAFILDFFILGRRLRPVILSVLPYALASVPLMIVARMIQPGLGLTAGPWWQRPIVSGASLSFYLGKLFVPIRMAFDYDWRPVALLTQPWFWWVAAIPLILALILLLIRRKAPWLFVAALVSTIALLPTLGLVPFDFQFFSTVADHYMVLAILGPAIAVAGLLSSTSRRMQPVLLSLSTGVLLIFAALSFHQLSHWKNERDILQQMIAVSPQSALAHHHLGDLYRDAGNLPAAKAEYLATQANPLYYPALYNLAHVYALNGEPTKAVAAFHRLLEIASHFPPSVRPDFHDLPRKLALDALHTGRINDLPVYLKEMARVWFARRFESWLGGPMAKYVAPHPL